MGAVCWMGVWQGTSMGGVQTTYISPPMKAFSSRLSRSFSVRLSVVFLTLRLVVALGKHLAIQEVRIKIELCILTDCSFTFLSFCVLYISLYLYETTLLI